MTNLTRSFQNSRFAYLVSAEMMVLAFIGATAGVALGVVAVAGALIAALSLIVYVTRQERRTK